MKQNSNTLIDELIAKSKDIIADAAALENIPDEILKTRPDIKSWNVLECLEHMNMYGDYYLQEINDSINKSKYKPDTIFKSGWFGNYSVNSMLPKKDGSTNWPMKTFPDMDPHGSALSNNTVSRFITQMNRLVELLDKSRAVSLRKTKCKLTIKWLKFSLGDTLRFMIYHNYRHMLQVKKILSAVK